MTDSPFTEAGETTRTEPIEEPPTEEGNEDFLSRYAVSGLSPHPEDLYKQIGFQIALGTRDCPEPLIQKCLDSHEAAFEQKKQTIEAVSNHNVNRYEEKIREGKIWFQKEYDELLKELPGKEELIKEMQAADADLVQKRQELFEKFEEFFKYKQELIKEKLKNLKEEVNDARQSIRQVYEDKKDLLLQFTEDFGGIYDEKLHWLRDLKERLRLRYERIQEELQANDLRGISTTLFNFLIALGTTGAVVAGWFFSAFLNAEDNDHYEHLTASQVIANVMDFSSGRVWWQLVAGLVAFLFAVFLLSAFMKKVYDKERKKDEENSDEDSESWEYQRAGIGPIAGNIAAKNWYLFWLKICPWLFIIGGMLILMSYTKGGDKIPGSITGEAIGFLACIALSGAAYIYISNKNKQQAREARSTRMEITILFFAFVAFNICVGVLLFTSRGFIKSIGYQQFKQFFSLVNFVLVMAMTSFIIAYGQYYKGVVSLASFLNWKINKVDEQIRRKSGVESLYKSVLSANQKNRTLIDQFTQLTNNQVSDFGNYLFNASRNQSVRQQNPEHLSYPALSEPDAAVFPAYDLQTKFIASECQNITNRRNRIDNEIKALNEQQRQNLSSAKDLTRIYNNQVHQWNNEIIYEKYALIDRLQEEDHNMLWQQTQLKDGFNLGMLYRTHEAFGKADYYIPCTGTENKKNPEI